MSKQIQVGSVAVGGGAPVSIQSMCNTPTQDVAATVSQILRLEKAGCEIIRVAVPDQDAARAVGEIKRRIHIPLVCDIHFDYKLALLCAEQGADKIRINPGNIGSKERRVFGKGPAGQIRRRHGGGVGGERPGPCASFERL